MTDTYEGWSNRETWCAQLWMTNEEGIYEEVREQARELLIEAIGDLAPDEPGEQAGSMLDAKNAAAYELATYLRDMWEGWAADIIDDPHIHKGYASMVLDVGSLYRVDWKEIAESWIVDAREELETDISREMARQEAGR